MCVKKLFKASNKQTNNGNNIPGTCTLMDMAISS